MKRSQQFFLAVIGAALLLSESGLISDPWTRIGWFFHSDVKSWSHTPIIFTPLELCLMGVAVTWLLRAQPLKRPFAFQRGTLLVPVLLFAGALTLGVLNGTLVGGGNLTVALWEVRGFLMLIGVYLLSGIFIREEEHLNQIVWVILIAATGMAIENILRWLIYLRHKPANDLAYDHIDALILAFAVVLALGVLLFGGMRKQRRLAAVSLPIMFFAMEVMKRRAAFAVLAIGVVILLIFALRLRPRLFWKSVLPLAFVGAIYLALFWHNTSIWGQPARSISSIISPDPRDAASNQYRTFERYDIIANIQSAPLLGLGFGQQFVFYYPLPNLSFWPFWHYTPHNAILWVWMKDGAIGALAFWWLMGRGAYDGSKAVETQREQWEFLGQLRTLLARRIGLGRGAALTPPATPKRPLRRSPRAAGAPTLRLTGAPALRAAGALVPSDAIATGQDVPTWKRAERGKEVAPRSAALALLVAAVCLIPMQVTYSYVDLGLTSERDMLLLGLMLGIIARAYTLLGVTAQPASHNARAVMRTEVERLESANTANPPVPEVTTIARRAVVLAPTRSAARPRPRTVPLQPAERLRATRNSVPLPWEAPDEEPD